MCTRLRTDCVHGLRQVKPGKGGRAGSVETFRWSPAGNQSCPDKAGNQPEPSVAWTEGDLRCEAYTGSGWAVTWSLESISTWGPTPCQTRKATSSAPINSQAHATPPGSKTTARLRGFSRNLGDP